MDYAGFYINLDRNPERRAAMEAQLARLGLEKNYRRFSASDGNALNFPNPTGLPNGVMGCFTSHYLLMKENLDATLPLHVIEDDILLAGCMRAAIEDVIRKGLLDHYDLIFTDILVPTSSLYYKAYKNLFDKITKCDASGRVIEAGFQLIDLRDKKFVTAASFVVGPRAIQKLHDLYAAELTAGTRAPVDILIWQQVAEGTLKAACLFPFVTSVELGYGSGTMIGEPAGELFAAGLARHSFFVERDLAAAIKTMNELLPLPDDPHLRILMHVLGFSFTDKYKDF
jgi:GR25 family glycosyltransferase involved in LPS biosynthesis